MNTLEIDEATDASLKSLLRAVPDKAEGMSLSSYGSFADGAGMFLYAKLVIENLKDQLDLSAIRREAENLPNGLDQA